MDSEFLGYELYRIYIYKAVISLLWGGQEGLPLICVKATHVSLLEKVKVERSVQFSRSVMSDSMQPHGLQHARLPCLSPIPGACWNSCPLSEWCHPTMSHSLGCFFFCFQSFPVSGSFLMSWLFLSGGQSIGASASVLPMNIQGWFFLGLTGFISLQSKGLSRVFSSITVQKHQIFSTRLSL